jgi:hypothetical protein
VDMDVDVVVVVVVAEVVVGETRLSDAHSDRAWARFD